MTAELLGVGAVVVAILAVLIFEWEIDRRQQKTTREILRGLRQPAWKSETREERKP